MRHLHSGRKLGVDPSHRKAMLRQLTLSLIEHETIKTTIARAKELRWFADRVVTLAKRGDVASRRVMIRLLGSTENYTKHKENRVRAAIGRVYSDLAPRYKDRPGGYTQIVRLNRPRAGDKAPMVLIRYLPDGYGEARREEGETKKAKTSSRKSRKAASAGAPKKKAAAAKAKAKEA